MKNMNIHKNLLFLFTITFVFLIAISLQGVFATSTTITEDMDSGIAGGLENPTINEIILEKGTYKGINNIGLNINNNVTIRGNDAPENVTIDATGFQNVSIFKVNADMLNITFINLTFTNGEARNGGAVSNGYLNSNLTFINCIFTNNQAIDYRESRAGSGGAIYNLGHNLYIENCTFINNRVYAANGIEVICTGGAIYNKGNNVFIINSNFTKNSANNTRGGGAIYNEGHNINITHCTFNENKVYIFGGGAIYNREGHNFTIQDSNFTNNEAGSGGPIFDYYSANFTIMNSTFKNNIGTIYFQGTQNLTVENSTFTNNAAGHGGAINFYACTNFIVKNSNFTNNEAEVGGALYVTYCSDYSIIDSNFTDNIASIMGGAIYNAGGYSSNSQADGFLIENSNFISNEASYGGAIYNRDKDYVTIISSTFLDNKAEYGGAIYNNGSLFYERSDEPTDEENRYIDIWEHEVTGSNFMVKNTNFTDNTADKDGGAIYNHNGDNFTVIDSKFTNNEAGSDGGAIYNYGGFYIKETWIKYYRSEWIPDEVHSTYSTNGFGFMVKNTTFEDNVANQNGGAIYNYNGDNFVVVESEFDNNTAENGGAIYNIANVFTYTEFWSTFMDFYYYNPFNNALEKFDSIEFWNNFWKDIYNSNLLVNNFLIENSNFTNNEAYQNGGVIYNEGENTFNVLDSQFIDNTAENGGAIYNQLGTLYDENYWNQLWREYWEEYFNNDPWYSYWFDFDYWYEYYGGYFGWDYNYINDYVNDLMSQPDNIEFMANFENDFTNTFINDFISGAKNNFWNKDDQSNSFILSSSNFTKNTAHENGGVVYNIGNMMVSLNNMTDGNQAKLGQMIYNIGNMGILNLTYLENKTINVTRDTTIEINATLTDDMGNTITGQNIAFIINGEPPIYVTSEEGKASISYTTPNKEGLIPITGNYGGHGRYGINTFNAELEINVIYTNTTINIAKPPIVGEPVNITGIAKDIEGNPLANTTINITINGIPDTVKTDENGMWIYEYTPTTNSFEVTVDWAGNSTHYGFINSTTFSKEKINTTITITPQENIKIPALSNEGNPVNITGILRDEKGNPIANKSINVTIDSKTSLVQTDENGRWSVPYIPTKNGTISIVAKFAGDEDYNPCENTATFTVTKGKIFVNIAVTENPDGSITITANVTDDEGNPVINYPVDFYMDGKNIGRKYTDNNGIASITIPGDGKEHEFKVLVPGAEIHENSENIISHIPRANEGGEENSAYETDDDNNKDDNPIYEDNPSDEDKTPLTSSASMKNTGIPIIVLLIVLLSNLGMIIRKKII
ncbi:MAG: right-handed parallel beta-helix repeat-containing protein [Methanobrevibacter sp.]|nr:right-handed parallel beta-helix repeat-containing protein [Methanobrevibacter sp.]